jgi:two-component system response regulator VicR
MAIKKGSDFKIAVIDDHVQTAIGIANALDFEGFKTFQGYSFDDAINIANKENPDLFIVDVMMNGKNGYDVAKALPKVKVILMTAYESNASLIKKLKNVQALVQKPIENLELIKLVRKILNIPVKN